MEFVIPAGSAANLPKELVDKLVDLAVERSIILKLADARDQYIEIVNEGTIPVTGAEDLDKVYRIDNTSDITTLTEMSWDIQSPSLAPIEMGTYIYLKRKQVAQYPTLKLDAMFRNKISRAIARTADKVALIGNTAISGATNPLTITNGLSIVAADASKCATTPVTYTTSTAAGVLDAIAEATNDIGVYGEAEYLDDLILFASPDFIAASKKSAATTQVGYTIDDYAPLGLKKVVFLHGIPIIKRSLLTGEKAILTNLQGIFCGYYGKIEVDVEHKAGRRSDLLVVTFWFDYKWGLLDSSSKALGMVQISKTS